MQKANRGIFRSGKEHRNWTGGRTVDGNGYVRILVGKRTYKKEHIVVMEKHIGRKLKKNEVVHHINLNRQDNRIENLKLMDMAEHSRFHNLGYKQKEEVRARLREIRKGTNQKEVHPQWKKEVTREKVEDAIRHNERLKDAAEQLGVHADTLRSRMKYYGIYKERT